MELKNLHSTKASFTLKPSSRFYSVQPTTVHIGSHKSKTVEVVLNVTLDDKTAQKNMAKHGVQDWIFIKVCTAPAPAGLTARRNHALRGAGGRRVRGAKGACDVLHATAIPSTQPFSRGAIPFCIAAHSYPPR